MNSVISFRLKEGKSWDIDNIIVDLKIIIVQLHLTTHNYWETERQTHAIISKTAKKHRGQELCPAVYNNLINRINEREATLGPCKGIEIICDHSSAKGAINERGGLRLIGCFSKKDEWVKKITEYFKNKSDIGELQID
jgi:ferredoxin-like protein FixX